MRVLDTVASVTLAMLLGAATALADPPADKPKPNQPTPGDKAPGGAQKPDRPLMKPGGGPGQPSADVREDAKLRHEKMREQWAERAGKRMEARHEYSDKFKAKLAERRTSRLERRAERREMLKKHWGQFAQERPFMAEFQRHAWRMARLNRMQMLAEELEKPQLLERISQLIDKEEARHKARLDELKSEKPGPAPAAASAGPPGASGSPLAPPPNPGKAAKEADK